MHKIGSVILIAVLCCAITSMANEKREIAKPVSNNGAPYYYLAPGYSTGSAGSNGGATIKKIFSVNPNAPKSSIRLPGDRPVNPSIDIAGSNHIDKGNQVVLDTPPNDNCVDVIPSVLNLGETLTFTGDATEATSDCPLNGMPEVWEAFTTTEEMNVVIDYCGTSPMVDFFGMILTQCPCDTSITANYARNSECEDGNYSIFFNQLPAGTYYFPVFSYMGPIGNYTIHISSVIPPLPPPNDNCSSVIPAALTPGSPLSFTGTGIGATNDCPLLSFPEVWEAFSTTEELNVTIDFCGTSPALFSIFTVLTQCQCDSLINCYGTADWNCGDGNASIIFRHLPAGTYYYPVMASEDAAGPYTLHVTAEVPSSAPENDNCANAEPVGEVQDLEFSTYEATFDGPGVCVTTPNIWYLYTPSANGDVTVDLCSPSPQYSLITKMAIYESTGCPDSVGVPIQMMLQGGEDIPTATPINDPLPIQYSGTTNGYSNDYTLSSCTSVLDAPDVVYSYAPSFSGSIIVTLCGSEYNTAFEILDQNENVLACNDDYCGIQSGISDFQVTAGQTYYIVISGSYMMPMGNYILNISAPAFTLLDCNEGYCLGKSQIIFNAELGHQYLIEIGGLDNVRDSIGTGLLSIYPVYPPPPNDDCAMADYGGTLIAGDTLHFEGNCTGATIDCPMVDQYPEAWISFTTQETMNLEISYCGSPRRSFFYNYLTTSCPCNGIILEDLMLLFCLDDDVAGDVICRDLPAGTYYYPVSFVTGVSEGPYSLSVYGTPIPDPQTCSEDALFGQPPSSPNDPWIFYISDMQSGDALADDFTGLADTVNQITWWGLTADQDLAPCDPETMPFTITFCHNGGGLPGEPADTVAIYNVTVTPEVTDFEFQGYSEKKFVATLNPPLRMNRGWVIIRGNGADNCLFLWQDGLAGNAVQYDGSTQQWVSVSYNLSYCLDKTAVTPSGCNYAIGDANGSGVLNGLDVTYSVGYFKGGSLPPYSCECTPGNTWYVAGDVNGSCSFNGLDVTYMVSYFKGGPACHGCADCLPTMGLLGKPTVPPTTSTIGDDAQSQK
jgi:hypothetical protein